MGEKITGINYNNKIISNAPVTCITQDKDGVHVHYFDSNSPERMTRRVRARYVVVAVPPPLAGKITYEPAVPTSRDIVTSRMRMGSIIKCFVIYSRPFWREKGLSGESKRKILAGKFFF